LTARRKKSSSEKRVGYARVSTSVQTTDQQVFALQQAGCTEIFIDDGIRATAAHRPGLQKAREILQENDCFIVTSIDRAFRSTIDAIQFLDELMRRGVEFQSLAQQINTRTPEGRKWFIDAASWAEYERAIISRRTREKMADAKRRGQHLGRPFALSKSQILKAHGMIQRGEADIAAVAARYGVSPITLKRGFRRQGLDCKLSRG